MSKRPSHFTSEHIHKISRQVEVSEKTRCTNAELKPQHNKANTKPFIPFQPRELKELLHLINQYTDLLLSPEGLKTATQKSIWIRIADRLHQQGHPKRQWHKLKRRGLSLLAGRRAVLHSNIAADHSRQHELTTMSINIDVDDQEDGEELSVTPCGTWSPNQIASNFFSSAMLLSSFGLDQTSSSSTTPTKTPPESTFHLASLLSTSVAGNRPSIGSGLYSQAYCLPASSDSGVDDQSINHLHQLNNEIRPSLIKTSTMCPAPAPKQPTSSSSPLFFLPGHLSQSTTADVNCPPHPIGHESSTTSLLELSPSTLEEEQEEFDDCYITTTSNRVTPTGEPKEDDQSISVACQTESSTKTTVVEM